MSTVTLEQIHNDLEEIKTRLAELERVNQLLEDLEFAWRTEEAYREIREGKGIRIEGTPHDVVKEMQKW